MSALAYAKDTEADSMLTVWLQNRTFPLLRTLLLLPFLTRVKGGVA